MKKHIFIFGVNVRRHRLSAKLMRAVGRGAYITCTASMSLQERETEFRDDED